MGLRLPKYFFAVDDDKTMLNGCLSNVRGLPASNLKSKTEKKVESANKVLASSNFLSSLRIKRLVALTLKNDNTSGKSPLIFGAKGQDVIPACIVSLGVLMSVTSR